MPNAFKNKVRGCYVSDWKMVKMSIIKKRNN